MTMWKSKKHFIFWVYVRSLTYPACKAHAAYCHLWPARLYSIFPHYLIKRTIKKCFWTQNVCFLYSLQRLFETFLILRRTGRDIMINIRRYSAKKSKSVPLQARRGPEGSRKLRLPDFVTTAQDGGKVVSLMHRPSLPPGNAPGTHFC